MTPTRILTTGLAVALAFVPAGVACAGVSASVVASPDQLLTGSAAAGVLGDMIIANDEIVVIISAVGHVTEHGINGGTVIDAGTTDRRVDALGELYTYFDDDWPRQAMVTGLTVLDDGATSGRALIRATGYDSYDSSLSVTTDYSLREGERHLTLTTSILGAGHTRPDFELGDAFHWGTCSLYAPGFGSDVTGTTTQAWIAGESPDVVYAYAGRDGDCWGPHGGRWSDLNVMSVDLLPDEVFVYTRFLAVTEPDLGAAVTVLHDVLGLATAAVGCTVTDDDQPLGGASIEVRDAAGDPYVSLATDGAGRAAVTLPAGAWSLEATAPGYLSLALERSLSAGEDVEIDFPLTPGATSHGWALGDTLTVIQRPLVNIPAMTPPSASLEVQCDAAPSTTGWRLRLIRADREYELEMGASTYDPSTLWWTLNATVPSRLQLGAYDLRVSADGGLDDVARHSVHVLDEFADDFYFVHITDTHLPDHRFSDSGAVPADSTEVTDLRAVIDDLNLIGPEFVLITGDYINEGELEDYLGWRVYSRAQRLLYEFDAPTYLIAGNHDIGGWTATPPADGTARRNWWRFFGWHRLDDPPPGAQQFTQNYAFDYGDVHLIGLESYDNYDLWREEIYGHASFPSTQLSWLEQHLAAVPLERPRVLFYHYDFRNQIDLEELGVDMALWGHTHGNGGDLSSPPFDIRTAAVCDGRRTYRLIRFADGELQPQAPLEAGASGRNLRVVYSPPNDGTNPAVAAQITNEHDQRFESGRLRFVMPAAGGRYVATGGQVIRVEREGAFDVCLVEVDIAAESMTNVLLSYDATDVPVPGHDGIRLSGIRPNPFNPMTVVSFELPFKTEARVEVFDVKGRRVKTLAVGRRAAGLHEVRWDGSDDAGRAQPSGLYFVRLSSEGVHRTGKVVLAR